MFPDQSLLHDGPLREAALALCERIGLSARPGVVACTVGPTIDTPSERRWFARAGARVSVQRLGVPLIAAAHAGLGVLAIVVVTAQGDEPVDIGRIAATSNAIAPAIDDLLWKLAAEVQKTQPGELERDQAW
jgi:purine nucleoside phosphorylase